jgi:hypothetical protein
VELLIFVIALCALAFLATRFGYDSRASAWSKEAEMGAHGVTWAPHCGMPLELDSRETADMRDTEFSGPSRHKLGERPGELVGGRPKVTESGAIFSRGGGCKWP